MADDSQPNLNVKLAEEQEVGVFADFAAVWHTPNTFVLDFLAVTQPQHPVRIDADGPHGSAVDARVAARVRIPPEQVFPFIRALQEQAEHWMRQTGRSDVPPAWAGGEG